MRQHHRATPQACHQCDHTRQHHPACSGHQRHQAVAAFGQRALPRKLRIAVRVEQPPEAAHGSFELPLPRLIERFDQVVLPALLLRREHEFAQIARLFQRPGTRAIALLADARPAGFADQQRLVKCRVDLAHHCADVCDGHFHRLRFVLPVRQDVHGNEIDMLRERGVHQPELPHIGVGDRHIGFALRTLEVALHRIRGLFAPQQHLVADDQSAHHVAVPVGQRDGLRQLDVVPDLVAAYPGAEQHRESVLRRQFGHMVQALIHRVEPHAGGDFRQPGKVGVDALAAHPEIGLQRRFAGTVIRSVRHALQSPAIPRRVELHIRHRVRRIALPQPHGQQRKCDDMHQRVARPARRGTIHAFRPPRPGPEPGGVCPATGR